MPFTLMPADVVTQHVLCCLLHKIYCCIYLFMRPAICFYAGKKECTGFFIGIAAFMHVMRQLSWYMSAAASTSREEIKETVRV